MTNCSAVSLSERLLTARDLAELLGVHPRTILRFAYEGRLPCRRIGRQVRFDRREVEDFLTAHAIV